MKSIEPQITNDYLTKPAQNDLTKINSDGTQEHQKFCGRCCPKIYEFYKKKRLCILISYFISGQDLKSGSAAYNFD